jgi:hypothetical protein
MKIDQNIPYYYCSAMNMQTEESIEVMLAVNIEWIHISMWH